MLKSVQVVEDFRWLFLLRLFVAVAAECVDDLVELCDVLVLKVVELLKEVHVEVRGCGCGCV